MSKAIYICYKNGLPPNGDKEIFEICKDIEPDNIIAEKPLIISGNNTIIGVSNPKKSISVHKNSLLLGVTSSSKKEWFIPNTDLPEGSFAIFRYEDDYFEIISDASGSRTIWYYKNDDFLIASTSQIAIVSYLKNFDFNPDVIPWLISTGSLGPNLSWDKRINQLPPNSSFGLNRILWEGKLMVNEICFKEKKLNELEFERRLTKKLATSLHSLKLNFNDWILPLSGGYDSRGILCFIEKSKIKDLKSITWGLSKSKEESHNDAYVASKLAKALNINHNFYTTDLATESIEFTLERFIKNGEGRIDHIAGYLDGFKIWKVLHEEGVQGIIRGDEGFGWQQVSSELTARMSVGLGLCSDYSNLTKWVEKGILMHQIPQSLLKKESESIEQWRDRLYHSFRLPVIIAALSDLKLGYVEQINPLLTISILEEVRKQPDKLRTDKYLFKKIVDNISPNIEYAKHGANAWISDILKQEKLVLLIQEKINQNLNSNILPEEFLREVLLNLKKSQTNLSEKKSFNIKSFIKSILPIGVKNLIKDNVPSVNTLDYNLIALRLYVLYSMIEEFQSKAKV